MRFVAEYISPLNSVVRDTLRGWLYHFDNYAAAQEWAAAANRTPC